MRIRNAAFLTLAAAVAAAAPAARAASGAAPDLSRILGDAAAGLGVPVPPLPPAPPVPPAQPDATLEPESGQVNFQYAEMVDRMERMSRTVIGRNKRGRRRATIIRTGAIAADRVERGEIQYVVLHASGGGGACGGSVSHLLNSRSAAHFIVCRDGQVTRMVRIEDIAIHVKNRAIDDASVGIETESGSPAPPYFVHGDWDPVPYWRMYASIAWLVRAVAKETGLPRDRAHIITHREADLGIPGAHVDPGPDFDGTSDPAAPGSPAVPYDALSLRFPGENVTPREYLMRLINDDVPPQIWMLSSKAAADQVEVKDTNKLGLSHVTVWRLDARDKPSVKQYEWSAPPQGMPPDVLMVVAPTAPGDYRVVARDLVGNTSSALLKIASPVAAAPAPVP